MIYYSVDKNFHSSANTGMLSISRAEALAPRMVCDDGLRIIDVS